MIQKLKDKLDLTKKYPEYFGQHTRWLVRVLFAAIFVYILYLGITYGWGQHISVSCPEYAEQCFNEYYYEGCTEDYCSSEYLLGGETRGEAFPENAFTGFWLLLGIGLLSIISINHMVYVMRQNP